LTESDTEQPKPLRKYIQIQQSNFIYASTAGLPAGTDLYLSWFVPQKSPIGAKNLQTNENREDGSDFDDFRTNWITKARSISEKKLNERNERKLQKIVVIAAVVVGRFGESPNRLPALAYMIVKLDWVRHLWR
jgi:hypothetical protein